jgi:hypothetical protein
LRRKSVPSRFVGFGAGSGFAALICILSTISANFSSVVPVASYAKMPCSLSSSWTFFNSSLYSSTSSFGNCFSGQCTVFVWHNHVLTFDLALQPARDLSIDTSFSHLGVNSGVSCERLSWRSARISSHTLIRASRRVRR